MTLNLWLKGGIHQPVWDKKGKKSPLQNIPVLSAFDLPKRCCHVGFTKLGYAKEIGSPQP